MKKIFLPADHEFLIVVFVAQNGPVHTGMDEDS